MPEDPSILKRHLTITQPSSWIVRFAPLVPTGGSANGKVLDLAAGAGRHARYFLQRGHPVLAVDRSIEAMADLSQEPAAEVQEMDLETGASWPFSGQEFSAIIVSNYLFRPHLEGLVGSLAPGGVLLYETFARGNEVFNRPRNPDHLLKSGELLELVNNRLQVIAYEHGETGEEPAGVKQRICAVNDLSLSMRDDGEPPAHRIVPEL